MIDWFRHCGRIWWRALCKYVETDGEQRAASFAYYAFFAIFPLMLLFVSIGSQFLNRDEVAQNVVEFVGRYVPVVLNEAGRQSMVFDAINGVLKTPKRASFIALVAILWSSLGFFHAIVRGVNRAWGTIEYSWWKLPFKNLAMLAIVASALLIGVVAPAILNSIEAYTWRQQITFGARVIDFLFRFARLSIPTLVLFYGFTMFYKFAPRGSRQFSEVWLASAVVTFALQALQSLFVLYVKNFTSFNTIYGTFGGVVIFLMWIYLSGSLIIFGGCLSAAQDELGRGADEG